MRPATVADMSIERQGWQGPLPPGWEHSYYTYTDFEGFMAQLTPRFPGGPAEYARIARECFEDLAAQNVVYAEVNFDGRVRDIGDVKKFWSIMEALEEERRHAEEKFHLRLNYLVGLMRTLPVRVALYRIELAAEARARGMGVVGIDLHGDEEKADTGRFAPAYALAREYRLGTRAHAGEARGPESVWQAIDALGAKRIGHGIRAAEDPALMARLQQGDITLEMCPTSNVRIGICPDLPTHPIRRFFELGIPVTVNSDDPLPFFTNVEREMRLLIDEMGFSRDDMRCLALTAAGIAILPDAEKAALTAVFDAAYHAVGPPRAESAS